MERKGDYFITKEGEIFKIADGTLQLQAQVSFYDLPQREEGGRTEQVDRDKNGRQIAFRTRVADQRMLAA